MADKTKYRVRAEGIDWPKGGHADKDEITDKIPAKSIPWLLEQGHIEEVKDSGSAAR